MSLFNPNRSLPGGPRHAIRYDPLDDLGLDFDGDRLSGGGRRINLDPIGPLPKKIITPEDAALTTANGFTLAQLDRAARFEVAEGVPLGIYYGTNLFGLKLVSHIYDPVTPEMTATGLLGEGWGGLGAHGEWERVVKVWYAGQELTKRFDYTEWFRDRLPVGAVANAAQDGWNWVSVSPTPYLGKYSHQSPLKSGIHEHFFSSPAFEVLASGDIISTWIYLDPTNPPTTIGVTLNRVSGGTPQAYWGPDNLTDIPTRFQILPAIPATGQWVRLDIPVNTLSLAGQMINAIGFRLFNGAATWGGVVRWQDTRSGNSGYQFRPGTIAHNSTDIIQRQELTVSGWLSGLAYNGSAGVTVHLLSGLVPNLANEDRPDAVKVLAECRRTYNYDASGAEIVDDYGYSASPARAVADRFLYFFQRRYRTRLDIAQDRFRRRIYWPSWVDWRDNSAALIPWDREGDGVNVFVPRAEFHGGFTGKTTMAQALDEICGASFTGWQDEGEQIVFVPPKWPPNVVHHFHPGNIVKGGEPQRSTESLDARPNRVIVYFRDVEGEFHEPASIETRDDTALAQLREDSINRVGEVRSEHAIGGATFSQAGRMAEYIARLEHDNPVKVGLVGNATSLHVLPWDFVTVSHPVLGWTYQLCLVRSVTIRGAENSADEAEFTLQAINGQLYSDAAHKPRQGALTL